MYGVIGEDRSDVETLEQLIRRIANDQSLKIQKKGYSGCDEMLLKGARQLKAFRDLRCSRFVICFDSDEEDPENRKQTIIERIIRPSQVDGIFCALVPVKEIEAWILADLPSVTKIFPGWRPSEPIKSPEREPKPKETLIRLSRTDKLKPRYDHVLHNPKIAKYLNLEEVRKRCPSFAPLLEIVRNGAGNVP